MQRGAEMKIICEEKKCCGCRACENICPRKAITMVENNKGFLKPVINEELCVDCGLCKKVCPIVSGENLKKPIKIYACKNIDENVRGTSSSGGVFQEIAKNIFKDNGIVYGAGFSKENKVEHVQAKNLEELENIKKSKYVQSDMKNTYIKIKENLDNKTKVLFSGTPCQVDAVKNFCRIDSEEIFFVDVVCHGVPSPKFFEEYKKFLEKKYNSKIKSINFRHKNEKSTQNIKVEFENGETYISNKSEGDYFYNLFLENIILRDACYNCKYKNFDRCGDISLADFWGYEEGIAKEFGDNKGVSLVLINTQKGLKLFDSIKQNIKYLEVKKEDCFQYNCFYNFEIPERYDKIWKEYFENGFDAVVSKYY